MAQNPTDQDWRSIAEQASTETDQAKLATLVAKLCLALDLEREQGSQFRQPEGQTESFPNVGQRQSE
jgi:hypothetical protein